MNRHIEKAYKAWRATLDTSRDPKTVWEIVDNARRVLAKKYAGTGRWARNSEHREIARKAALKRWAKAKARA